MEENQNDHKNLDEQLAQRQRELDELMKEQEEIEHFKKDLSNEMLEMSKHDCY